MADDIPTLWADATFTDLRDRIAQGATIAILPVGATEAHGPHLPLGTDVILSTEMARRACLKLGERGRPAWVLPPLAYTPAQYAAPFPGTLGITPELHVTLILELARALGAQDIELLVLANSHFDPVNVRALYEVERRAPGEVGLPVVFPDATRRRWSAQLTEEFQSGACHAGRYEGSQVLAVRPELVHEARAGALPPRTDDLAAAIRAGVRDFKELGSQDAYFGDPARATAGEGQRTYELLAEMLATSVEEFYCPPPLTTA